MFKILPSQRGFTLIELLIVIAVLGILATITVVAIDPSARIRDAQDAQRILQISQIQGALEAYFTSRGNYPIPSNGSYESLGNNWYGTSVADTLKNGGYLKNIPMPPTSGVRSAWWGCNNAYGYWYVYCGSGCYYMATCLDSWSQADVNNLPGNDWGNPNGYAVYYYLTSWSGLNAIWYPNSWQKIPVKPR